ncbi:hypothetical protein LX81_04003 [Palleronia aestuarii]|uniref:Uncharacterized protein n=1 Tax=Palleronia aestuarii TaxID=568105 RepID=A0A2W7MT42_9RHOB|nr:hypothetical protein [Palleronia aestuarii]PZX11255.1 hypothetical protein LX81_04003 [Palleronia aestuarii]
MNRLLAVSVLALSLGTATGALADNTASTHLVSQVERVLASNGYGDVDVAGLSDHQVSQLYLIGTSTDHQNRVGNDIRGVLDSRPASSVFGLETDVSLSTSGRDVTVDAGQLTPIVQTALDRYRFDVSAEELGQVQQSAIFLIATSDDESQKQNRISAILN